MCGMRGRSLVALGHAVLVSVPSVWLVFFTDSYSKYVCRMRVYATYLFGMRESAPAAVHSLERHVRNALFDTTWLGELTCCTICGYLTYDFTYVIYKRADTMWQFMLHHSVSFAVIWYCNVRATKPHHHQHHRRTHARTRTHRPSARDSSMR